MDTRLQQLKSLSNLLDSKFEGPFGIKFGLDGLLGFIPVLGDFATTAASFYIIIESAKLGCSPYTLARMIGNVLVENLIDSVPILGNFFDIFWKANNRNMVLLEKYLADPTSQAYKSRIMVVGVAAVLIFILSIVLAMTAIIFKSLLDLIVQ